MTVRFRRPPHVALVIHDDGDAPVIDLAVLPDGPLARLEGSAAVIWAEAVDDDPSELVDRIADRTAAQPDDIAADVGSFLQQLVERGLLEPTD
jgi:hypothetical protein